MNQAFRERIMREGIVDTKKYRYATKERRNDRIQFIEIRRIPIEYLDTTASLSEWELVERWKYSGKAM